MPEIPEIGVNAIGVPMISVGQPIPPPVLPAAPPVTSTRFPVIDMPGCVRARIAVGNGTETFEEDPRGNVTLCTGAVPVYEAPDYRPRDFTWVQPKQPEIKRPDVSQVRPLSLNPRCRVALPTTQGCLKIHRVHPLARKKSDPLTNSEKVLAGYELQDGKCVKLWDPVPIGQVINNYVPDAASNSFGCA